MNTQKTKDKIDRRSFLYSAAGVGAGLVFSPVAVGQERGNKKPDDINVALLGAGSQGHVLAHTCQRIPGIRFKAVCDIWTFFRKRVSRLLKHYHHEHNTYTDYRDMLDKEKDLDAVIIATPDFWHSQHTVACLEAGLHVYCETPMSNTVEDAAKMVEAARRTGKLLQIGCQRRSNPQYIYCYDKLLKGRKVLGRVAAVSAQWNRVVGGPIGWPRTTSLDPHTLERYGYESMAQFRNWRWYKGLGGGPVVSLGSHQINTINWFLGTNPGSVMACGRNSSPDKKKQQWYDTIMAVYEYETDKGPVFVHYQILSQRKRRVL